MNVSTVSRAQQQNTAVTVQHRYSDYSLTQSNVFISDLSAAFSHFNTSFFFVLRTPSPRVWAHFRLLLLYRNGRRASRYRNVCAVRSTISCWWAERTDGRMWRLVNRSFIKQLTGNTDNSARKVIRFLTSLTNTPLQVTSNESTVVLSAVTVPVWLLSDPAGPYWLLIIETGAPVRLELRLVETCWTVQSSGSGLGFWPVGRARVSGLWVGPLQRVTR